jgi:hypothetical protein
MATDLSMLAASAPQAWPCERGQGAQYKGESLPGKSRPVGEELQIDLAFVLC